MLNTILPEEMKRVERRMMKATGTSGLTLMERAAGHVAAVAEPFLQGGGRLLAVCGTGSNGGDGLAAARLLMQKLPRLKTTVWKLPGTPSPDAAEQWNRLSVYRNRLTVVELTVGAPEIPADVTCALDALFGTGLNRALEGVARLVAQCLNASDVPVVAVDIPSGLSAGTGYPVGKEQGGLAIRAAATVTFHRPKTGLFLGDGLDCCGRVIVGDIGIPAEWDDAAGMAVLNRGDRLLPPRKRNTHKGSYGRVLVLAGSVGMAGAAGVCATAALRAGTGLVTVACPAAIVPVVQTICPCATCIPLCEDDPPSAWAALESALNCADALIAGCGIGQGTLAQGLMASLIPWLCEHRLHAVLDADALNLLAKMDGFPIVQEPEPLAIREAGAPAQTTGAQRFPDCVLLTPHLGEAARLLGIGVDAVAMAQPEAARALQRRYGGSVVLKSASSVLIGADGEAINLFGTAAMAKGGSGDALAGVLGAMLAGREAYGLAGVRLLQTACALHGLAGLTAVEARGERGMLATDLCDALGRVPDLIERGIAAPLPHAQRLAATYGTETISMHNHSEEAAELSRVEENRADARLAGVACKPASALGRNVRVTVDRPLGSRHPERREIIYGLNYGYVADVLAADNEWQDAYIFGVTEPVEVFEGDVVAVIHRLNDVEDKWVVAQPGTRPTEEEIRARTAFVERYFKSEVLLNQP